jgi:hypothetical protein
MVQERVRLPLLFLNSIHSYMKNTYQIMSDFELCERIECLHQINTLLTGSYRHVFNDDDAFSKAVQKEIALISEELEARDY